MTDAPRERRRAPRALADFPVHLSPKTGKTTARLKDLSAIGLCCTTPTKLAEMTLVGIDLQLPGSAEHHAVKGAVVRCDAARGQQGQFEVAIWFTEVGPATRTALGAYVAQAAPA